MNQLQTMSLSSDSDSEELYFDYDDEEESKSRAYQFEYSFETGELVCKRTRAPHQFEVKNIKLDIPTRLRVDEIIAQLVAELNRQCDFNADSLFLNYLLDDTELKECLATFLYSQSQKYYDQLTMRALNKYQLINSVRSTSETDSTSKADIDFKLSLKDLKIDNIKHYWNLITTKPFKLTNQAIGYDQTTCKLNCDYLLIEDNDNESRLHQAELFAKMYHDLIHSDQMMRLLDKERQFAIEYNRFLNEREQTIQFLLDAYAANLNEKRKAIAADANYDQQISELIKSNNESIELEKIKWESRANALKTAQQRKFRRFIQHTYDKKHQHQSSTDPYVFGRMNSAGSLSVNEVLDDNDDDLDGIDDDFGSINLDMDYDVKSQQSHLKKQKSMYTSSMSSSAISSSASASSTSNTNSKLHKSLSSKEFTKKQQQQQQQQHQNARRKRASAKLEESYTIQLGAQLKSTHNLRLIRCDVLEYCRDRFGDLSSSDSIRLTNSPDDILGLIEPHTMQTAMSLYSDKLCAVVLLVSTLFPSELDTMSHVKPTNKHQDDDTSEISAQFYTICERNGCDFHFGSFDQQIEQAANWYNSASQSQNQSPSPLIDHLSSSSSSSSLGLSSKTNEKTRAKLNIGDFYITRHSNLSQAHLVFHLASFDSSDDTHLVRSESTMSGSGNGTTSMKKSDLSGRHPVLLGLRNILKTCISNNVSTLTFPLLLTHEMNDEMTISWVMKRTELVLKCVKGFMIELVQWGASDSKTLQFVVPTGLMDETFHSISSLIKTIFRESRTVDLI